MDMYHVFNRGVDKRTIVLNDGDRQRFVRSLFLFNDRNSTPNAITKAAKEQSKKRDQLVYIHAWCLMKNHYHLLLSPAEDDPNNLSLFMKKLNMGYAKFFNEKYDRSGALWQGKYKKILITKSPHYDHIPYYIHLNPLDYSLKQWRNGSVSDAKKAYAALERYRWSSYLDYNEVHNFPSILYTKELEEVLGSSRNQKATIARIISDIDEAAASAAIET